MNSSISFQYGGIVTEHQRRVEERAIAVFNSDTVQRAIAETASLFKADSNARFTEQHALLDRSAREHFFHSSLMAVNEIPQAPGFVWTLALAHHWLGLDVPASRFGHDNVDNCYRVASVDDGYRYRVSGRFLPAQPCDFSICALPKHVGENIAADVLDIVTIGDIDLDSDGRFVLELDARAREGRRNALCIAGAKVLLVRDSMADWSSERPSELRIERVDGRDDNPFDLDKTAARAAELGDTIARFFIEKVQHGMFERNPANVMGTPAGAAGQGGLTTQVGAVGNYDLDDQTALVLTIDRAGARYLGVQIVDMWMVSYEYSRHTSSFNHTQAIADADGLYRLVIARNDPGVYNWLDSGGYGAGNLLLRWQSLPANTDPTTLLKSECVKLTSLADYLPADTRYISSTERELQRQQRLQHYENRLQI